MIELAQKLVMKGGFRKRQVCKLLSTVWTGDDYDQLILCLPL